MAADQVDYKGVLADLKARRAALDQAIAAIEAIAGGESGALVPPINGPASAGREIEPGTFFNLNTLEATKKFLGMMGGPRTTPGRGTSSGRGVSKLKTPGKPRVFRGPSGTMTPIL